MLINRKHLTVCRNRSGRDNNYVTHFPFKVATLPVRQLLLWLGPVFIRISL